MNLVLDIGNTLIKVAAFEGNVLQAFLKITENESEKLIQFVKGIPSLRACMISTVRSEPISLLDKLKLDCEIYLLDESTPLPFRSHYITKETLGRDRLAGVAAAFFMQPGHDSLVIDAGTAITYDLITAGGDYLGGAISPGIRMRYQSLHTFTGQLPLLDTEPHADLIGNSTRGSIHSGVLNGVIAEVEGMIARYSALNPGLKIILTGGDHIYFDKQLKVKTFAAPNLVLEGLNYLLNYTLEKH